jgi:hypothetical protein
MLADPGCAAALEQMVPNMPHATQRGEVGRCRKRSRVVEQLALQGANVSTPEIGDAVLAEHAAVAAAGGLPAGAPQWAAPLFQHTAAQTQQNAAQTQHNAAQTQHNAAQAQLIAQFIAAQTQHNAAVKAELMQVRISSHNALSMAQNGVTTHGSDPLSTILLPPQPPAALPAAAPNFPPTRRALDQLTVVQLRGLLQAYGLPDLPDADRRERFKRFLGIRL